MSSFDSSGSINAVVLETPEHPSDDVDVDCSGLLRSSSQSKWKRISTMEENGALFGRKHRDLKRLKTCRELTESELIKTMELLDDKTKAINHMSNEICVLDQENKDQRGKLELINDKIESLETRLEALKPEVLFYNGFQKRDGDDVETIVENNVALKRIMEHQQNIKTLYVNKKFRSNEERTRWNEEQENITGKYVENICSMADY